MSHLLAALFPCLPIRPTTGPIHLPTDHKPLSEKPTPGPRLTTDEAASRILTTMMHTSTHDPDYSAHITSLAHQAGGWTESLAAKIVAALEAVLQAGKDLGPKLSPAYAQACEAAKGIPGFAAEHPLATAVFCTVLALGILVLVAPSVLELVGFGQLGPRAGSWAARWMARYAGRVPKGSLYSFLQRLGMVWK